jgi:NAD-dependent dihydropyrimidine dehydrogenase PreA subunit
MNNGLRYNNMTHVITSLCVRDGGCLTVCPVDCIVAGNPQDQYPLFYIDPETCIDCGACIRECLYKAIYPLDEVPVEYHAKGGEILCAPVGTPGFEQTTEIKDFNNKTVRLPAARRLIAGDTVDLSPAIQLNMDFFNAGPGYQSIE